MEYQNLLKEFARSLLWKFKKRVCSDSVKIPKADSQKIQNMTRFLSNATKSGFAGHHHLFLIFSIFYHLHKKDFARHINCRGKREVTH